MGKNKYKYDNTTINEIPKEYDNIHGNYKPEVLLIEPKNNKLYGSNELIQIKTETNSLYPIIKMDVFINGSFVGTLEPPF